METIYKVTTEGDCEGRSTSVLGYCTGIESDIEKFYADRKNYSLSIEKIDVIHITPSSSADRIALLAEKKELERKLNTINEMIK
jgi:predicted methyltransferase